MSRTLFPLSVTAVLLGSAALADVPNVATDITPVHSLVARVMDGVGEPDLVISQGASPHEYNLRPSEAGALQDADLVFWIGEDLTPWLDQAIETLAQDATVVGLLDAQGTDRLGFRESPLFEAHDHGDHDDHGHEEHAEKHDDHGHDDHDEHHKDHDDHGHDDHGHEEHAEKHDDHGHDDHGEHHKDHDDHGHDDHDHEEHAEKHDDHGHDDHDDHHKDHDDHGHDDHDHEEHAEKHDDHGHDDHDDHAGHAHGAFDPHAWLSPDNAATWLNTIAAALSAKDPDNAGAYFANAAAAREELAALKVEISGILDPVRGGNFIVFHDAYQYFETEFDFPASGAISFSDASDPSPARIAEIRDRIADQNISCVLSEPQYNPNLVTTVMAGTDVNTAILDPLGVDIDPGQDLYPNLLRNLANALADCL